MVHVGFCGHNKYESNKFSIRRLNGTSDYLFLLFLVPFYVYTDQQVTITEPNACIFYSPGKLHHYQAVDVFKNSFLHFTTDIDYFSKYSIPLDTILYLRNHGVINQLIKDIVIESVNKTLHYEWKINCLFEQILVEVIRDISLIIPQAHDTSLLVEFQNIRMFLINNCEADWTTDKICRLTHMGKSQFYKYYSSFFYSTPKADIINARLEKSKNLLTNEELQINQVARMCGFTNIQHFTRYFKKSNNCTPSEYVFRSAAQRFHICKT